MAGDNVQQYFFRDQVTGDYVCSFCNQKYAKSTTSTRLRAHLAGLSNAGARRCLLVSQLVRGSLATERSKTQKPLPDNFPSSSCPQLGLQSTFRLDDLSTLPNDIWISDHYDDFGNQAVALQCMTSTHPNESGSDENLPLPNDMIGWPTQLPHQFTTGYFIQTPQEQTNEASLMEETSNFPPGGRARTAPNECGLSSAADLRNFPLTDQADQHEVRDEATVQQAAQMTRREGIVQSSSKRQRSMANPLPIAPEVEVPDGIQETGESASLTKCPVGDAFGRNVEKIRSWMMDDQVLLVGIYGMGGVGKTTVMRHIQTLLEGQSSFDVYWISVSQDISICKIQNLIAKKIGFNFSDEEDEVKRAKSLAHAMQAKQKCVLILDDLRNYFDVDEVGIPVGVNPCKLVLTTRSWQVCQQMCRSERNTIEVQALSKGEAWILFTQELGNYGTEVEELAKAVSRECAGLPLGIRVMARSMNGICDVNTWRKTLEELKESKVSKGREMREEVFSVLKFSYLRLKDSALQECLSYSALFPKDAIIDRNDLIEYMIVEGLIDERKSRQEELYKGHTMLDTLEKAYLLEGDTETVWMHDLIRMVILESREGSKMLVEAAAQLKELPDVEKWTENLERVSLIGNDIEVIPSGHTLRCPNLSTLLLCRNHGLKMIEDSFFEQFPKLKVLDLSGCGVIEELPRSISDLVNLIALLLRGCMSLICVPSLAKLKKLKKLDLSRCENLKQMPEGVRFLLKLKYLDLSGSGIEEIGSGIIPMLPWLQVLKLCDENGLSKISIRGSEVGELRMLETLHCRFSNVSDFGDYMKSRERSQQSLSDYSIFIQRGNPLWPTTSRKFVSVTGYSFIYPLALPTDIETLNIYNCKGLFPSNLLASLLNLQEIRVCEEENEEWREFLFSNYSTHSLPSHSLLHLKLINISNCDKLKKLFPPCLLPHLHNLQTILVEFCDDMEEIFSTDQEEDGQELSFDQPNLPGLNLSRLTTLKFRHLPKLRSIYKGAVLCQSLPEIELTNCPQLQRITLPLPQPHQRIHVYPDEWWDSVQWGSANDKNHLESWLRREKQERIEKRRKR